MPIDAEILDIRDVPSGQLGRVGHIDKMLVYKIGSEPARMVTYPSEEHSDDRIKRAIKEDQANMKTIVGKKFSLD
jgi:hypothetical protein